MANFRRGKQAASSAKSSGNKGVFTPTFNWSKDGDEHFLKFLTPADEVLTILYHKFIIVGEKDDGGFLFRDFVSPTDPAFDGESGSDPLIDRFDVQPKPHNVALAVAMEPVTEGGKVVDYQVKYREYTRKTDDGGTEDVTVPDVRLVIQSIYVDLFDQLWDYADVKGPIEDVIFKVTQKGAGKDKSLSPWDVAEAGDLGLDDKEIFDYEGHLEKLASPERFAQYIDPLPDDAVIVNPKWDKRKNKGGTAKAAPKRRTQVREDSSRTAASDEDKPAQSERFARLRREVTSTSD